jgi:hypothetical protein
LFLRLSGLVQDDILSNQVEDAPDFDEIESEPFPDPEDEVFSQVADSTPDSADDCIIPGPPRSIRERDPAVGLFPGPTPPDLPRRRAPSPPRLSQHIPVYRIALNFLSIHLLLTISILIPLFLWIAVQIVLEFRLDLHNSVSDL